MTTENNASKPPHDKRLALRSIAMPADTNANGDIFGGWILSQMDLAGAIIAGEESQSRVATVGIAHTNFLRPVYIGDEVSCYTEIKKIGNTSITISIETWARRVRENRSVCVTQGEYTYVAIGEDRSPIPIKRPKER